MGRVPPAAALNAGTDSEMVSTNIRDFGEQLLAQHRITMARLDDAVRRILRVKFRAGLFDHPYVDQAKAADPPAISRSRRPRAATAMPPASRWSCSRTTVATLPLESREVGRRDRPAGRRPARHARTRGGAGSRCRRGLRAMPASRRRTRTRRSPRAARSSTRIRRTTRPRASAARTPASRRRSPRPTRPIRSCWRSARAGGRAARPPRAARSTCPASSRS